MIQTETILKVVDNTGAKTVKCIKVLHGNRCARTGDCILVSIKSIKSTKGARTGSVKKGQIYKALVVHTKKGILNRKDGTFVSFRSNDAVLIQGDTKATADASALIGSRIFGPITRELRAKNYKKIISKSRQRML
jgi:large subunit ribosomal protein L14